MFCNTDIILVCMNRLGGVMVSVLTLSAVDCGFKHWYGQIKDYKIGICWFSPENAVLWGKCNNWSARNQNNVSEWKDLSTQGLMFQWASAIKIQLIVQSGLITIIIISSKCNLF